MENIKVFNCARCGKDHYIQFKRFKENNIDEYNFWGICKNTNEPVLMKLDYKIT